ncbi:MAG TPA: hypothetical protein PLM79_00565 [Syntrophobacteraceae bacterium]|nr:hypothetical protein [Syntrophobacteraceae bacterium]
MTGVHKFHVAVLGAVPAEVEGFFDLLEGSRSLTVAGRPFLAGNHRGRPVLIGTTGLGKVNAAITTAALLQGLSVSEVWNVGTAGCYVDSPLNLGDVLVTETAWCGDEGVLTREGVLSSREIGIPVLEVGGRECFDSIPLDAQPLMERIRARTPPGCYTLDVGSMAAGSRAAPCKSASPHPVLGTPTGCSPVSFRIVYGPSLTVGMVSGDEETARLRSERFSVYAENMEGSAVIHACLRFGVPVLECRGISNTAGDRFKDRWQTEKALSHCRAVVGTWLS